LFYEPEALIGRRVVVVANLKPATLMGLESRGMLLAGSSDDDSVLAMIEPDASLPLGARVR
jgi:methionyl-tRNA synthetase